MTPLDILNSNMATTQIVPILFSVGSYIGSIILSILLETNIIPVTKRGFFCDDNSIKYPYQEETVSVGAAFLISLTVAFMTFLVLELSTNVNDDNKQNVKTTYGHRGQHCSKGYDNKWFIRVIKLIFIWWWCITVTSTLTSIIKTVVGWPRPNFLEVCNPNISCTLNNTKYNMDFACQGTDLFGDWKRLNTDKMMRGISQARRSFPSGHTSFSASAMAFLVFYVESRIHQEQKGCRLILLKPFIQLILISIAVVIGMSRVKDYYHHLIDVLVGATLGTVVSFVVWRNCSKWLQNIDKCRCKLRSNKIQPITINDQQIYKIT